MEHYVNLLMDGSFKGLVLNPKNEDDEVNIEILKEMMKRKVSFEVRYSEGYNEFAIHLIINPR